MKRELVKWIVELEKRNPEHRTTKNAEIVEGILKIPA